MAIIVEDGTAKVDAESYISVADADSYHSARGNTLWTGADALKEAALRKATEYMMQAYRRGWKSFRTTSTQALDWPRAWMPIEDAPYGYGSSVAYVPSNVIPVEVKRACAELALIALSADLNPALERTTLSERVGPLEVTYDPAEPVFKRYRSIDQMLATYLCIGGASVGLTRS